MTDPTPHRWSLTLYVNGTSPQSVTAINTMQELIDEQARGSVDLTIVDVSERPALAIADQVLAVPTLVRNMPAPVRRLVGHLADPNRVRLALDLDLEGGLGTDEPPADEGPS